MPATTDSHYFDSEPGVPSSRKAIQVVLPDCSFTMSTDRGVFSNGELDAGTKLLLLEAPAPPATGTMLDLGCGAGAIALTLALRSPGAVVYGVDVNQRALALCRDNAATLNLNNVTASTPEDVTPELRFDVIWSNPPIRIGKPALHELLSSWLPRLTDCGLAVLVVSQHLGADSLATWITKQGFSVERIRSRVGYRLLTVRHANR